MSKVTMPEPDIFDGTRLDGSIASHGYSATALEAYAAAKVRESLVQAESILRGNAKACKSLAVKVLLSANADAIGELIPPLPGPVEP